MGKSGEMEAKMGGSGKGGRHGAGANSKNMKPSYMSHLPEHMLNAHSPHSNSSDRMSHQNLMGGKGGDCYGEKA